MNDHAAFKFSAHAFRHASILNDTVADLLAVSQTAHREMLHGWEARQTIVCPLGLDEANLWSTEPLTMPQRVAVRFVNHWISACGHAQVS
jgi:hypothetical protein